MMEKTMLSHAFKPIRNIKIKKSIQMFHLRAAEPLMTTQPQQKNEHVKINFEHISHLCSCLSIVNFEHVTAG